MPEVKEMTITTVEQVVLRASYLDAYGNQIPWRAGLAQPKWEVRGAAGVLTIAPATDGSALVSASGAVGRSSVFATIPAPAGSAGSPEVAQYDFIVTEWAPKSIRLVADPPTVNQAKLPKPVAAAPKPVAPVAPVAPKPPAPVTAVAAAPAK